MATFHATTSVQTQAMFRVKRERAFNSKQRSGVAIQLASENRAQSRLTAWSSCLASTRCGSRSIYPKLQQRIRRATDCSVPTQSVTAGQFRRSLTDRLVALVNCETGDSKVAWAARAARPWIHERDARMVTRRVSEAPTAFPDLRIGLRLVVFYLQLAQ